MKSLRKILIPIAIGFTILALIGLASSALFLYREAASVHEVLGWSVIFLLAAGLALFIVYPIARLLMLPRSLLRPDEGRLEPGKQRMHSRIQEWPHCRRRRKLCPRHGSGPDRQ